VNVVCAVCGAKTDANLCKGCTAELERAIAELPALLHELDVTISRQDRGVGAALYAMKRSKEQIPGLHYDEGSTTLPSTSWPFSWDAADLRWRVESTVVTWARHILESRGVTLPIGPTCIRCSHESCALIRAHPGRLLLDNLDSIRLDEAADVIFDELVSCRRDLIRAIDRQAPDVFAGRCDSPDVRVETDPDGTLHPTVSTCGADLYAHLGETSVRCGACGHEYDLAARKQWLVEQVPDVIANTTAIANALTGLQEPVTPSMIRQMAYRGEIVSRGPDPADPRASLYRVGDVLDVLAVRAERKAQRSDRRRVAS
jgi:hypothetical protein